ncbi:MAG: HAMP domain-containing histidine kinase [Prevotella sp.]|nr:HAMP domain-containing histidine kinase [Prevotella sp.]
MRFRLAIIGFMTILLLLPVSAAETPGYQKTQEYLSLRDSMRNAFNTADSARFFVAVKQLEDYLYKQGDLHAYYTQRCNEIVFHLNQQRIMEAYKLAHQLSKELTERKLDKEMYMAINMMGHIYRYCGNKESAKQCFWEVIHRLESEGYHESLPPIYMNLVNIYMNEDPKTALELIDKAVAIANQSSPDRVFDIETRRTVAYYLLGDKERFLQGYHAYKEGEAKGLTSVHGHIMEIYYLTSMGKYDEAIRLAAEKADDPYETQADIYSKAGRWEEAYRSLQLGAAESDSINSVILSGSMQDIQKELELYEIKRQASTRWFYALFIIMGLLVLLLCALGYIFLSHRRYTRNLKKAYQRVLESDQMKTAFIQNVSHEVRTPLNIISGFAQVIAAPDYQISQEERRHIADTMIRNSHMITTMISEVLDMSDSDNMTWKFTAQPAKDLMQRIIADFDRDMGATEPLVKLVYELPENYIFSADELLLKRIVNPLLDNAVKNDPQGKATLRVSLSDDHHLLLCVEDKGKGIPADEAEHIFERFVKLDAFKQGLGLGLTFSRTMARRVGGDVFLDTSYPGPGARLVVKLPVEN